MAAAATAASLRAQQVPFRSNAELVPIYATVTDQDTRLVSDLAPEDFQVLDDGKPQRVTFFRNQSQSITAIVVLDTSAAMTSAFDRLRAAAEQLVLRLLPGDQARICVVNDTIQFMPTAFSSDRDLLAEIVRGADYGNGDRLYDGLSDSLDALRQAEGRRVIMVLSGGGDLDNRPRLRKIMKRADAEDVMVYAIGIAGRSFDGDDFVRTSPLPGMKQLAGETGGAYFELTRSQDVSSTFTRVERELHSQYVLAFIPAAPDGRVHSLVVRARGGQLNVRARRTYLSTASSR